MTLAELYTMLNSIEAFTNKVTYRMWQAGEVPALPYICYLSIVFNENFYLLREES